MVDRTQKSPSEAVLRYSREYAAKSAPKGAA